MGTFTAQILVGEPHIYHGGIEPTHYLFLSENDRPAWILVNQNIFENPINLQQGGEVEKIRIVWIPSAENMLDDALLMIAIHVMKNKQIIDFAQKIYKNIEGPYLEMNGQLTHSQRDQLYEECRRIKDWPKIVVTVMGGSSIKAQLPILKKYSIECEICVSK